MSSSASSSVASTPRRSRHVSQSVPGTPGSSRAGSTPVGVSFSGNWLVDLDASASLAPLLAYHGVPVTPSASIGLVLPADAGAAAVQPSAVPALIIKHVPVGVTSRPRFTSYLHALQPVYDEQTKALLRYDPADVSQGGAAVNGVLGQLAVHEEYVLDGEYHTVKATFLRTTSTVEARAYTSPSGMSVVVDTRCTTSKYDLERCERFLEDGGKRMIVEYRILSCAPEFQTSKTTSDAAPPPLVVKEILFLRRVYNRLLDADPSVVAKEAASLEQANTIEPIALNFDDSPSATSAASTTKTVTTRASFSTSASSTSASTSASAAPSAAPSPRRMRTPAASPFSKASASAAALFSSPYSSASNVPPPIYSSTFPPLASTILPAWLLGQKSTAQPSFVQRLRDFLYPTHHILQRYELADLVACERTPSFTDAATAQLLQTERRKHDTAMRRMMGFDVLLLLLVAFLAAFSFGVFDKSSVVTTSSSSSPVAVEPLVTEPIAVIEPLAPAVPDAPIVIEVESQPIAPVAVTVAVAVTPASATEPNTPIITVVTSEPIESPAAAVPATVVTVIATPPSPTPDPSPAATSAPATPVDSPAAPAPVIVPTPTLSPAAAAPKPPATTTNTAATARSPSAAASVKSEKVLLSRTATWAYAGAFLLVLVIGVTAVLLPRCSAKRAVKQD